MLKLCHISLEITAIDICPQFLATVRPIPDLVNEMTELVRVSLNEKWG